MTFSPAVLGATKSASGTLSVVSKSAGIRKLALNYRLTRAGDDLTLNVSGSADALRATTIGLFANGGSAFNDGSNSPVFSFSPRDSERRLKLRAGNHKIRFTLRVRNLQYQAPTESDPSGDLAPTWTDCAALGLESADHQFLGNTDLVVLSQTDRNTGQHV